MNTLGSVEALGVREEDVLDESVAAELQALVGVGLDGLGGHDHVARSRYRFLNTARVEPRFKSSGQSWARIKHVY